MSGPCDGGQKERAEGAAVAAERNVDVEVERPRRAAPYPAESGAGIHRRGRPFGRVAVDVAGQLRAPRWPAAAGCRVSVSRPRIIREHGQPGAGLRVVVDDVAQRVRHARRSSRVTIASYPARPRNAWPKTMTGSPAVREEHLADGEERRCWVSSVGGRVEVDEHHVGARQVPAIVGEDLDRRGAISVPGRPP